MEEIIVRIAVAAVAFAGVTIAWTLEATKGRRRERLKAQTEDGRGVGRDRHRHRHRGNRPVSTARQLH